MTNPETLLPGSWAQSPIGDLLLPMEDGRTLHHGWSPQCEAEPSLAEDEWGVLKTTAIQNGAFMPQHNKRLPSNLSPRPSLEVKPGDIILTCAGPRARCGVPCLVRATRRRLMISGKMYRFRVPEQHIEPRYLEGFLRSSAAQAAIDRMKTGISDSGLNLTHDRFRRLKVPIAPLGEQKRIVAEFEKQFTRLDAAVAALHRVRANLKRYRAAVLNSAVEGHLVPTEAELARREGRSYETASELLKRIFQERHALMAPQQRPFRKAVPPGLDPEQAIVPSEPESSGLPEGWCWVRLGALLREPLRNGHSAKASVAPGGVPTFTLSAVTYGDFSSTNIKLTTADPRRVEDLWVQPDDIFIERSNTPELVGTARRYSGPPRLAIFPDLLIRVRVVNLVVPAYIELALQSPSTRQFFRAMAQGISGTMPKIDQSIVEQTTIPLPPVAEQRRIVAEFERLFSVTDELETQIQANQSRADRLRQAILRCAFEGKLVPQDPTDEPADVLLARVRAEREVQSNGVRPKRQQGEPVVP
jgi:type I restriction enzyme S subunit